MHNVIRGMNEKAISIQPFSSRYKLLQLLHLPNHHCVDSSCSSSFASGSQTGFYFREPAAVIHRLCLATVY
ncbi:hypothetical protein Hanom_Chr15g01391881 [Helianthus anomalus]